MVARRTSGWRLGALPWNVAKTRFISIVFVLACSILLAYGIVTQKEIAGEYARAFDERMLLLQKSAGSEKEIAVTPLPSSGLLYSAEISTDTAHFTNRQLRDFIGLPTAPKRSDK